MTKLRVLFFSLAGTLLYFSQFLFDSGSCGSNKICNEVGDVLNQDSLTLIIILPFVFLFSLITYNMREEIFQSWWHFARWFVPLIIVSTFLLYRNGESSGVGMTGIGSGVGEAFILSVLYAIFIITSLVKIILAYRRLNRENR